MIELIHAHIPKTGGVSFLNVINKVYKEETIAFPWTWMGVAPESLHGRALLWGQWPYLRAKWREVIPPKVEENPHLRVLQGHFPIALFEDMYPKAKRICFVRHPIARVVSHWHHDMKHGYWGKMSLLTYAKQPENQNVMAFHMGHNIDNFDFVGVLELIDREIPRLAEILEWPFIPEIPKLNVGGYKHDFQGEGQEISQLNKQDMAIYANVLGRKPGDQKYG